LYTEKEYDELEDETLPEIKRCNLASVILMLKAFGVDNILDFDYLDAPARHMRMS
jgi:HrpA-like RNA helicase